MVMAVVSSGCVGSGTGMVVCISERGSEAEDYEMAVCHLDDDEFVEVCMAVDDGKQEGDRGEAGDGVEA